MESNIDKALNNLGLAWNEFLQSKDKPYRIDDDDLNDFRKAIHDAQRIIFTIKHLHVDYWDKKNYVIPERDTNTNPLKNNKFNYDTVNTNTHLDKDPLV